MASERIRPPAQAGRFYPSDPEELRETVRELLDCAPRVDLGRAPVGLVSPHAGYSYSGATAARAYRQIEGAAIERVVVFAPSHTARFRGGALFCGAAFATPLGTVPVDTEAVEALKAAAQGLFADLPEAHAEEHSLEVQLPFLQVALDSGFKLVPVLICDQSEANCLALSETLCATLDALPPAATVVVASSDLYHGNNYKECRESDGRFEEALLRFDPRGLLQGAQKENYAACGLGPVAAAMNASKRRGAEHVRILQRTNSRDACGATGGSYVVGYAAAAFC